MAYEKSVIDINITFENEAPGSLALPRPVMVRKCPKDKITLIQPSPESQRTSRELNKRVLELQRFRKESQSADISPLLVTALVRKTQDQLTRISVLELTKTGSPFFMKVDATSFKPIERFRKAARVVLVLVTSCMRWRRYRQQKDGKTRTRRGNVQERLDGGSPHRKPRRRSSGIGFGSRSLNGQSKLDLELREILTCLPRVRTHDQLKKVQRLCRKTRSFLIFPVERELDVARYVGYERYDDGRIIACQGRPPARFYYILSGRISKVCLFDLAAGVTKMSIGELMQGCTTDPVELQNGSLREHSLICKGPVEVLVLERDHFLDLVSCSPDNDVPLDYLRNIELFRSFPMEKFLQEKDTVMTKYFAKDAVIVKNSFENPFFYIVKSGRCKVVREQDVLDLRGGDKLPAINVHNGTRDKTRDSRCRGSQSNLLELSKAFSKDFASDKSMARPEQGGQSRTRREVDGEMFITESPLPSLRRPDFRRTMEFINTSTSKKQDKPDKPVKRVSDLAAAPTRKALLQIAILKPGDMFGLEPMMTKAASKISAVEGAAETSDPSKRHVILISEGAECIMINKRFFLKNACITTLVQLRALKEEYMSVEQAREQIQNQQAWNLYKREMVRQLAEKTKRGSR